MRLLYIGWANHVHLARWASFFAAEGHKVWILPVSKGQVPGCTTLPFVTRKRRLTLQTLELNLYNKLLGVDVVHVHWAGFGHLPCSAGIRPYVITVWGSDVYRLGEYDKDAQSRITNALRNAALVTVDSEDIRNAVIDLGVAPEQVEVIQWGVDTKLFRQDLNTSRITSELNTKGKYVVYSPRNIEPIYNNDVILRAFAEVLRVHPDTVLVQKHYKRTEQVLTEYLALAERLGIAGQVRLVGDMEYEQLPYLYGLADVVVSVPSSDATPMSVLEAMACGCYPIVSDLPSLREWIEDGKNGSFVPVGDSKELAVALVKALESEECRRDTARVNREIVELRADHHTNMKAMEAWYGRLIKEYQ